MHNYSSNENQFRILLKFFFKSTYECTEAAVGRSRPAVKAVDIEVVVVDASMADVNSSICLDVSTTTSVI